MTSKMASRSSPSAATTCCFAAPISVVRAHQNVTPVCITCAPVVRSRRRCIRSQAPPAGSTEAEASVSRQSMAVSQSGAALVGDDDGEPLLHVVFVHPQIHWNTGNIGRTCLGLGARLHLVGPLGFSLDARQIRRAGLDYWEHVDVRVHEDWSAFADGDLASMCGPRYLFTKFGTICASDLSWGDDEGSEGESDGKRKDDKRNEKIILVFGSEVDGFDGIRDWVDQHADDDDVHLVAFPMVDDRFRSFNLSTTASMALWDAYKTIKLRRSREKALEPGLEM